MVFDLPDVVTYQRMNGALVDVPASQSGSILTLRGVGTFTVDRLSAELLQLTGRLGGRQVAIFLQRQPLDDFTLRNRGFHWVQAAPFFG
jgi:hypothetical protein